MSILSNFPFHSLSEKIKTFSVTHIVIMIVGIVFFTTLFIICKKFLSKKWQKRVLWIMWFVLLFFVLWSLIYKSFILKTGYLNKNSEYYSPARWFNELIPLTLCRVNFYIFPIALLAKKNGARAYTFFISMLGAFAALIYLVVGLDNYIDYFVTHFIYVAFPLFLVGFGFYTPRIGDLGQVVKIIAVMLLFVHCMNSLYTMIGDNTVEYYTNNINTLGAWSEKGDIVIFVFFYKILPVPYFYLFLFAIPVLPVWILMSSIFIKKNDDKDTWKKVWQAIKKIPSKFKNVFTAFIKDFKGD